MVIRPGLMRSLSSWQGAEGWMDGSERRLGWVGMMYSYDGVVTG